VLSASNVVLSGRRAHQVDPVDWTVYEPILQHNVQQALGRSWTLLGLLLPLHERPLEACVCEGAAGSGLVVAANPPCPPSCVRVGATQPPRPDHANAAQRLGGRADGQAFPVPADQRHGAVHARRPQGRSAGVPQRTGRGARCRSGTGDARGTQPEGRRVGGGNARPADRSLTTRRPSLPCSFCAQTPIAISLRPSRDQGATAGLAAVPSPSRVASAAAAPAASASGFFSGVTGNLFSGLSAALASGVGGTAHPDAPTFTGNL